VSLASPSNSGPVGTPTGGTTTQGQPLIDLIPSAGAQTLAAPHFDANHMMNPPPSLIPPLTANAAAGASSAPSIASLFAHVEPAVISAILLHDFPAEDLYKLETRIYENPPKDEGSGDAIRRYRSIDSIIHHPFLVYIGIVVTNSLATGHTLRIMHYLHQYIHQFLCHAQDYESTAVLIGKCCRHGTE